MKTILNNKSRTTTIEAPSSAARERLVAQLTIQKGQLAVKEMQVKAGECTEADLQFQQRRIAALEQELTALDADEAFTRQLNERRRTELPTLERELNTKARHAARVLIEAREALMAVRAVHEGILALADNKCPGFSIVPGLANTDLVSACGSGGHNSLMREMIEKNELLDRWLARLKAAGVEV